MCTPSVVADDWVTKGCHIKINGIELAVRPNHRGGIVFTPVFSSDVAADVQAAIAVVFRDCLPKAEVRRQWVNRIGGAMVHLGAYEGALGHLARGRLAELNFLRTALERWDVLTHALQTELR
jgi:hypothetical protein